MEEFQQLHQIEYEKESSAQRENGYSSMKVD